MCVVKRISMKKTYAFFIQSTAIIFYKKLKQHFYTVVIHGCILFFIFNNKIKLELSINYFSNIQDYQYNPFCISYYIKSNEKDSFSNHFPFFACSGVNHLSPLIYRSSSFHSIFTSVRGLLTHNFLSYPFTL